MQVIAVGMWEEIKPFPVSLIILRAEVFVSVLVAFGKYGRWQTVTPRNKSHRYKPNLNPQRGDLQFRTLNYYATSMLSLYYDFLCCSDVL